MGVLRELYRRMRIGYHKPRHWRFRPGTIDRRIFRNVVVENEYHLPARFQPHDVILDVGGHIGSFTHAVLLRGAGRVHCCEPDAENFQLLLHNLAPYSDRVRVNRCAVWRSDVMVESLSLHNPRRAGNTGGVQVTTEATAQSVPVLPFDEHVANAAAPGGRIRLLKLDCEGAEWPILFTARSLDRIDAICGEYHVDDYPEAFHVSGFPVFTPEALQRHLQDHGFHVVIARNPRSGGGIGNFFACR